MLSRVIVVLVFTVACFAQPYATNADPQLALYIRQALENNPGIGESLARYRASEQQLPQASALPDPTLGFTQYLRNPETRVGPQTTMISVSQHIPWFGKLSDKEKIAATEAAVRREEIEAREADLVRQVKTAYYSLAYLDEAIVITEEDAALLQHYESLARARYSQGVGLQQAVVKLQAEITKDLNRLEELRAYRVDAEAALNALLNRSPSSPVARVVPENRPAVQISLPRLYELGSTRRPELRAALLQIERDEKKVHLARRQYWPDFTVGAGFTNLGARSDPAGIMNPPFQNGKNIYSITASANIPLRRRKYDAAVLQATEEQVASRQAYRNSLNLIESAIRTAGYRIESLERQISLFEKTLLPQAEQALRSAESAYSTGSLGVLELLDSERVLLEVRLGLAQLASNYMKTLADMERAIGTSFPEKTS